MRDTSIIFTLITLIVAVLLWLVDCPRENIPIMAPGWSAGIMLAHALVQGKA